MFEGFVRDTASIDGTDIAYVVGGKGPAVLLLHGYPQNMAMWARVAPRLAERYTVVCADLRGYGDSAKPVCLPDRSTYSFRALAADQAGLMRHLGFDQFHLVGHDRGARTSHRLALDHPDRVRSLTVMDIVPTYAMFTETNQHLSHTYWHWYFLAQPEPFPERMIGNDPDYFYETCLVGWGSARIEDFDPEMMAAYRHAWRDPAMIHASCSDYRAAATIDLVHDAADLETKVTCPTLVLYGADGAMARLFDLAGQWRRRCVDVTAQSLPGGHFFIDLLPDETAAKLLDFLDRRSPAR